MSEGQVMTIPDYAQVVSAAASVAALIIAALGAWLVLFQVKANAKLAHVNIALEAHRQLLCLCIEQPELSSSSLMLKSLKRQHFRGILDDLTESSERALWFLSYVLNSMEQILESNPKDEAWRRTMASQVDYHRDLLEEVWPKWSAHYGETLKQFVANELRGSSL